jgi:hypothetical protein
VFHHHKAHQVQAEVPRDHSWIFAITPDGKTAYVVAMFPGTITPVATATNTPGKPIRAGARISAIAITP